MFAGCLSIGVCDTAVVNTAVVSAERKRERVRELCLKRVLSELENWCSRYIQQSWFGRCYSVGVGDAVVTVVVLERERALFEVKRVLPECENLVFSAQQSGRGFRERVIFREY